jgi:hypothetical protein
VVAKHGFLQLEGLVGDLEVLAPNAALIGLPGSSTFIVIASPFQGNASSTRVFWLDLEFLSLQRVRNTAASRHRFVPSEVGLSCCFARSILRSSVTAEPKTHP